MSTMGFNGMACLQSATSMNQLNTSSIMPSVTCISSPLTTPAPPYPAHPATNSSPYPVPVYGKDSSVMYPMSTSIASLRLKAKQHANSGFASYASHPPLSPRSGSSSAAAQAAATAASLSACQYGASPDRPII